jgi:TFIIF-interacting CTD phosphatase-like protein
MPNIVLDIDETLLHSFDDEKDINNLMKIKKENIKYRDRITFLQGEDENGYKFALASIFRPGLEEFLNFCFSNFDKVIIWSAGQRGYVEQAVNKMTLDTKGQIFDIWSFPYAEKHKKGFYYKPLRKMEDKLNLDLKHTFIIDNQEETFIDNTKNAIHIPNYLPTADIKGLELKDDALYKLINWLSKEKDKDVNTLDKNNIFTRSY